MPVGSQVVFWGGGLGLKRALLGAALLLLGGCAQAPPSPLPMQPARLQVNVFPGAANLPLLVAVDRGFFAKHQLTVEIHNTPSSDEQRVGLAAGKFDIAIGAVDNAVAMVEVAGQDLVIVCGGDGGMNELMVRPEIKSIADLRGKSLAVDAPNTAFALVARKILKNKGLLEKRDYTVRPVGGTRSRSAAMASNPELAVGMLNPPFSLAVGDKGLKSLGNQLGFLGPYQATGAFVMRRWAQDNREVLERYLAAYIEGQRHAMNPANRAAMTRLLADRLNLTAEVAEGTYQALLTPGSGLAPDARLDLGGFKTVLALRAEMEGMWGGKAPKPDRFLDLSFFDRAISRLE
jgi:ABC-type nitrate/sulfonate/bicarbonate transport system substrate-binding protein